MGARQSSPAAANGRTRAYSGGDLPSSGSSSNAGANGTGGRAVGRYTHLAPGVYHAVPGSSAAAAPRSRSLVGPAASGARAAHSAFNIPSSSGLYGSQDSVSSALDEGGRERPALAAGGYGGGGGGGGPRLVIGSLPAHLSPHLFGGKRTQTCLSLRYSTDPLPGKPGGFVASQPNPVQVYSEVLLALLSTNTLPPAPSPPRHLKQAWDVQLLV